MSKFLTIDSTTKASIEASASNGDAYFNTDSSEVWVWDTTLATPDWRKYASSGLANSYLNSLSASFDGIDDVITSAMNGLTLGSMSLWVKPNSNITSLSSANCVVGDSSGSFNPRIIGLGSVSGYVADESICMNYNTSVWAAKGITIPSDSWSHIFVSWQTSSETNPGNAGYDFWFNGTKITGANAISGAQGTVQTTMATLQTMSVGRRNNALEAFAGKVDELAIWTGDVSADIANFSASFSDLNDLSVVSTPPDVWYTFGGTLGDTADGGASPVDGATIENIKNKINTASYSASASGATFSSVS